jgi:hypothetical protein
VNQYSVKVLLFMLAFVLFFGWSVFYWNKNSPPRPAYKSDSDKCYELGGTPLLKQKVGSSDTYMERCEFIKPN